jgi:zinc protease
MKRLLLLFALAATAAFPALSQPAAPLPTGVTRVTSVEGLTEYRLANGLRAVVFPDPSQTTITVNITYLAGSREENYGEAGMAHLIEHLMSFGSPKHPDAKREQNDHGAQRNASTYFDRTNYYETFPASDANLDWALDLESDRMMNAFVTKESLASQMSVVRNEYERGENNPGRVLQERVFSTAYLWHNYGRSTIGSRSDIESVPIERLQEFYKRYYRPDNAVIVIAGKLDEASTVRLLTTKFGALRAPSAPIPATYTSEPAQDGERFVALRRAGDVQLVMAGYHIPATSHPDNALVEVLNAILTSGPSSRLQKTLVETKKASGVTADTAQLREPGLAIFTATVRKDASLDAAKDAMLSVLDGLAANPVTPAEVERAKAQILAATDLELANSSALAMDLTEWSAAGDWRLVFLIRDRIRQAAAADVQRVALQYLKPSNRTLGIFQPEDDPQRSEIPNAPDPAVVLRDYKGDPVLAAGEVFDPSIANIESRIVRSRLPNGMKVALLQKKNRGGAVSAVIRLNYGETASLKSTYGPSALARATLIRGTAAHTRQQLQDEMNRLKLQMTVSGSVDSTVVALQTVSANLEPALRLAAEILRQPAFSADEFEQVRQAQLASLEASRTEPTAVAPTELVRLLNPYPATDPRYVPTADEAAAMLKATTLEAAKQFHQDFYGTSNGELVIAGDLEKDAIAKLALELFGSWRSPQTYVESRRVYQKTAVVQPLIKLKDKANASVVAGQLWAVGETHPDYPALVLANYMLGGHSTSRLYLRIRTKDGLSYGVSSSITADSQENWAQWSMTAITNPLNAPQVVQDLREEIDRVLKEGFAADEVAAARKGWADSRQVQRAQDSALAARILLDEHNGRTMQFDATLEAKVAALTPEAVNAAIRRYMDPANLTIIQAGDLK